MNRDVPFDERAECDICGKVGACDYMGDLICYECANPTWFQKLRHRIILALSGPTRKVTAEGSGE